MYIQLMLKILNIPTKCAKQKRKHPFGIILVIIKKKSCYNENSTSALFRTFFIYIFRDFGPSPQPTSIIFPTVYEEERSQTPLKRLISLLFDKIPEGLNLWFACNVM